MLRQGCGNAACRCLSGAALPGAEPRGAIGQPPWPNAPESRRKPARRAPSATRSLVATPLERIAAALERLAPAAAARPISMPPTPSSGIRMAGGSRRSAVNRVDMSLLQGHRPGARPPAREYRALRARPAGQQRAALGRARHGQVLAGQGGARRASMPRRRQAVRAAQADRNPPRGYREPARPDGAAARRAAPLHRVLRRPLVRRRRHVLQVAQGGAGRRHRGPARQRRSSTRPPTAAT